MFRLYAHGNPGRRSGRLFGILLLTLLTAPAALGNEAPTRADSVQVLSACQQISSCELIEGPDDVAYMSFVDPPRLERYDRQSDTWLAEILLPARAEAVEFTGSGLVVRIGDDVLRFHGDGSLLLDTPWADAAASDGIVYFGYSDPARIERYDMTLEAWLTDIVLDEPPTAIQVDADGLYVAFGQHTSRFALDGTGEVHLRNTSFDVHDIALDGNLLFLAYGSDMMSVDKVTGTQLDLAGLSYSMHGLSIASSSRQIFGRTHFVGPADILVVSYETDGTFGAQEDSPYHGDYPGASRTYLFPGQARVADNSGIVYNAADLTFANSLAGPFDDLSFYGGLPIVLRGDELIAYSNAFLETGRSTLPATALEIEVQGEFVFSFAEGVESTKSLVVTKTAVADLEPGTPGEPVDPVGLDYLPDSIVMGPDETVYLLHQGTLSIFRWSVSMGEYLPTIPLVRAPSFMAITAEPHRLVLAYPTTEITYFDLDSLSPAETPLVNSPQTPYGLATAGEFVFVNDPTGAWVSHFVYGTDGTLLSSEEWNYYSEEFIWSSVNRKMYHLRDYTSPNDLLWEDIDEFGIIGLQMDSPFHSSDGIMHPIRVKPDGSLVLLGSGRMYDAISLDQVDTLSNTISDAIWLNGDLITIRELGGDSQLQLWGVNYGVDDTAPVAGEPLRIFPLGDEFVAITKKSGKGPAFLVLNDQLESLIFADGFESGDTLAW